MTTRYQTPGLGASAALIAMHLPVGMRRTFGELRYEAGRSGGRVALPVAFVRADDTVVVRVAGAAAKTWWRDFRTPRPASIRIDGTWLPGTGRVVLPGSLEHEETEAIYQQGHLREQVSALDPYVVVKVNRGVGPDPGAGLSRRWFAAVTLGEFLGFCAPAVAGALTIDAAPAVIAAAMLAAGAIEGSVLGLFQARVLRSVLKGFSPREWITVTVFGALAAWAVGVLMMVHGERLSGWSPAVQAPVVVAGALVMVFAIGVAQWFVLQYWTNRAALWIWANAAGWVAGLGVFGLVTTPLWQPGQSTVLTVAIGALGGLAMAAAMAAINGAFLVRILAPRHLITP
ncbi:hypothetical protein [Nocardia sp. BMG51109]|uniref:hypothetical protein n=1 Tax=Nocardia sp. BMG51109 TaxID=1056816 RepID=UPI0012EC7099|nr:hypothetical protein [Nocardia sp. BMG51109]